MQRTSKQGWCCAGQQQRERVERRVQAGRRHRDGQAQHHAVRGGLRALGRDAGGQGDGPGDAQDRRAHGPRAQPSSAASQIAR